MKQYLLYVLAPQMNSSFHVNREIINNYILFFYSLSTFNYLHSDLLPALYLCTT